MGPADISECWRQPLWISQAFSPQSTSLSCIQTQSGLWNLFGHDTKLHSDFQRKEKSGTFKATSNLRHVNRITCIKTCGPESAVNFVKKKLTCHPNVWVGCLHGAVPGAGLCPPTRRRLTSHSRVTLQVTSLGHWASFSFPLSIPPLSTLIHPTLSQGQPIPRYPTLCPHQSSSLECFPMPKSPKASCHHPARPNNLLQNASYLYSRHIQKLSLSLPEP